MGKPYTQSLTLQSAVAATGNGTAMDVSGYSALAVQVTGTFVGTVTFEGTVDGSNWVAVQVVNYNTGDLSTTATAAGLFYAPVAGLELFRARVTWTSGTSVTITTRAVSGAGMIPLDVQLGAGTAAIGSLTAGEAVIGQVVGSYVTFTITGATVAVDSDTYASGDCLGAKLTLTDACRASGGLVYLQSVMVHDLTNQSGAMDLFIFNANPSATTFTDAAALTMNDADIVRIAAVVSIAASDYKVFAASCVAQPEFTPRMIQAIGSDDLYAVLVSRDTKTYVANEVALILGFMRD